MKQPPLTIGIEEEYLLVDIETRDLASNPPSEMMAILERRISGRVAPEFLRAQVEVETGVHATVAEARGDLDNLRQTVAEVAAEFGIAPVAAATHPFARWGEQQHVDKDRYNALARDLQAVARRLLICGMHVHIGIDDDDLRIDLMNQAAYFLPHLLALSTSSPFWQGQETGLMSYRTCVFDGLPRTGLPEQFSSHSDYARLVATMVDAGVIEDATRIWWDLRPSARFPTLEMRSTDVCTSLDDAIAIAAMFQCLMSMLVRLRKSNQRWRVYPVSLVNENRWLAQRYGTTKGLVDFGKGTVIPYAELLDEILDLIAEDADRLGCVHEVNHARTIIERGTSAAWQVETFRSAVNDGADVENALKAVVDMLIERTAIA
ncbi:MAG: carboxylate-amine ligase [Proteobacteria bacterium]|nr:carboxylate-amine ligase [Pseudomonadota bacterium]MDA1057514.1 carboxylate-amine ligase [Pseudomonadota bacterium]